MSAIQDILNQNHFTEDVLGVSFKLRVVTAEMSFKILGIKTIGLIRGASSGKKVSDAAALSVMEEMMPEYLRVGMVEPKFGTVTDAESNTISIEDLGKFAVPVFSLIMERSGYGRLINFPKSSEATKDEK